ncbi:MAG: PTS fructose transporter subunit IIA [Planctomycetota bacterium]|nr:MAG: PTS fructose transporter subunit IIA [Planctomycetota bacterium]
MLDENPQILTVKEVVEFLRVSERTVYDWATSGTIPCGKLGTTWRFKRSEVEKWVNEQLSTSSKKNVTFSPIEIGEILDPAHVMLLEADSKDVALLNMLDRLAETGTVSDKSAVTEGIFQREKLMSTGIGLGIGIPHVRMDGIDTLTMAVGVSTGGITDYESLDGQPVHLVFMILAGKDQHTLHIKTMSAISRRIKNPVLREMVVQARQPEMIYDLLAGETTV